MIFSPLHVVFIISYDIDIHAIEDYVQDVRANNTVKHKVKT